MKHTDETDARIRRAYENLERLRDVAAELGCTRNVIIGRARRLGLAETGRNLRSPFAGGDLTPEIIAKGHAAWAHIRNSDPERRAQWAQRMSVARKAAWARCTDEERKKQGEILRAARGRKVHQNSAPVKELERT